MKRLLFILLLLPCFTSGQITFQKTYGGSNGDYSYSITKTNDNGYAMAGSTLSYGLGDHDAFLVKTDEMGNILWAKAYGESFADNGRAINKTIDNGFIITGHTESFGAGNKDIYLVKVDSLGAIEWSKAFGQLDSDWGYDVRQTTDSGYIITGEYSVTFGTDIDAFLLKTNSSGDLEWFKTYGYPIPGSDQGWQVQQTTDGGYILTGIGSNFANIYVVKTDALGNKVWSNTYPFTNQAETAFSIIQVGGKYVVTGQILATPNNMDIFLMQIDSSGNVEWAKTYGGNNLDTGFDVKECTGGGYVIGGKTVSFGAGATDLILIRTDDNGNPQWSKVYGGTNSETITRFSIQQTLDNGFAISGYETSFGTGTWDIYFIKTDDLGNSNCNEVDVNIIANVLNISASPASDTVRTPPIVETVCSSIQTDVSPTDSTLCFYVNVENHSIEKNLTMHPNPTTGIFTVQGAEGEIQVHDLFGRLVLNATKPRIDMRAFPKGLYFVKVGDVVRKLVKQ